MPDEALPLHDVDRHVAAVLRVAVPYDVVLHPREPFDALRRHQPDGGAALRPRPGPPGLLSLSRPLERLTETVQNASADTELREEGPREVVRLAATINATRQELRRQYDAKQEEHERLESILAGLEDGVVVGDPGDASSMRTPVRRALLHCSRRRPHRRDRFALRLSATRRGPRPHPSAGSDRI